MEKYEIIKVNSINDIFDENGNIKEEFCKNGLIVYDGGGEICIYENKQQNAYQYVYLMHNVFDIDENGYSREEIFNFSELLDDYLELKSFSKPSKADTKEIENLKKEIDNLIKEKEELQKKNTELEKRNKELEEEIKESQKKNKKLKGVRLFRINFLEKTFYIIASSFDEAEQKVWSFVNQIEDTDATIRKIELVADSRTPEFLII